MFFLKFNIQNQYFSTRIEISTAACSNVMPRYGRKIHFACLQHFSFVLRGKLQILRFTNIKNVEIVEKLDDSCEN